MVHHRVVGEAAHQTHRRCLARPGPPPAPNEALPPPAPARRAGGTARPSVPLHGALLRSPRGCPSDPPSPGAAAAAHALCLHLLLLLLARGWVFEEARTHAREKGKKKKIKRKKRKKKSGYGEQSTKQAGSASQPGLFLASCFPVLSLSSPRRPGRVVLTRGPPPYAPARGRSPLPSPLRSGAAVGASPLRSAGLSAQRSAGTSGGRWRRGSARPGALAGLPGPTSMDSYMFRAARVNIWRQRRPPPMAAGGGGVLGAPQ